MGVWIETSWFGQYRSTSPSHPVWVCGLKLTVNDGLSALLESHPVWVCGLKLLQRTATSYPPRVTPCMGVWIETVLILTGHNNIKCHTLYGCVD